MTKLSINDIKIIPEGEQIKKEIISKYNSVDNFIQINNIRLKKFSVERYLRKPVITSHTLKLNLVAAFDKNYEEIVISEPKQILRLTDAIYSNIINYMEEDDFDTLNALLKLCIKNDLGTASAKLYRIIGMNRHRNNDSINALNAYQCAIDILKNNSCEADLYNQCCNELKEISYTS